MHVPDLLTSLLDHDLGHLRIIAENWGIKLAAQQPRQAAEELIPRLLDRRLVEKQLTSLPPEARRALEEIQKNQGRMSWAQFSRRHGSIRAMGPARRDRERPDRTPHSTSEILWYRALIGRTFLETAQGLEEFAYLPGDLQPLLPPPGDQEPAPPGRPALSAERQHRLPAGTWILDHTCTLLAALRLSYSPGQLSDLQEEWSQLFPQPYPPQIQALVSLLQVAGLAAADRQPNPEKTRSFLEASRPAALLALVTAWRASSEFNELLQLPGLQAEGAWTNNPLLARNQLLQWLDSIPVDTWWSLPAFIQAVKENQPDFQRPAGNYDTWYLRRAGSDTFLRGFEYWEEVDGALLRYSLAGPLHWLGILELGQAEKDGPPTSFRLTPQGRALLDGKEPPDLAREAGRVTIRSDAHLGVPRLAPRAVRYQIARFCTWEPEKPEGYSYRLTPEALQRAREQDLQIPQLVAILRRAAGVIPPNLLELLKRWEAHGTEARLEQALILRVRSPDILQSLRSSKAARFLGDALGPTAVIIHPGAGARVLAALAELGYLGADLQPAPPDEET